MAVPSPLALLPAVPKLRVLVLDGLPLLVGPLLIGVKNYGGQALLVDIANVLHRVAKQTGACIVVTNSLVSAGAPAMAGSGSGSGGPRGGASAAASGGAAGSSGGGGGAIVRTAMGAAWSRVADMVVLVQQRPPQYTLLRRRRAHACPSTACAVSS